MVIIETSELYLVQVYKKFYTNFKKNILKTGRVWEPEPLLYFLL